jgi:formyltetrahydrofolate-dependent phosphoribosylglycinamide formyltransferase
MTRTRIAVLASGGGTNLQAILDHLERLGARRRGDVVLVASDRIAAGALDRARVRGIPTEVVAVDGRPAGRPDLDDVLEQHAVQLVALAGYLRRVPDAVVQRYAGRTINVHPALLPAFGGPGMYGLRVHEAVLSAGVTITGVTVHFVDEEYDRGTIIAQWPVPVLRGDDPRSLAARVLRVEHLLYPRVVDAVAGGAVTAAACRGDRVVQAPAGAEFRMFSQEDDCLAHDIDRALGC